MLKVYLSVIHASLTLTDMHGYHTQLSMVTSDIDMISVVFIRDKLLKLHTSVSIHTTGISPGSAWTAIEFPPHMLSPVTKLQLARVSTLWLHSVTNSFSALTHTYHALHYSFSFMIDMHSP